jgi:alkanesulfonate monooxygenase SsuD/methylene tetrahydromethanopterin reductase-like flavin-dependent oxidoreductase (luciferase family)
MSRGRFELGIGVGWDKCEHLSYGYPYPRLATRIDQLRESLEIIKSLWNKTHYTFHGKYSARACSIQNEICEPKPLQSPHPPITIGGQSKGMFPVVASHADRWNFTGSISQCRDLIQRFKNYCTDHRKS